MEERRKWKIVGTDWGKIIYRKLNNELIKETECGEEAMMKEMWGNKEIWKGMELEMMYRLTMDLVLKKKKTKSNTGVKINDDIMVYKLEKYMIRW